MNNEPLLVDVSCIYCSHTWQAFCPDGLEENEKLECPKCRQDGGIKMEIP